MIYYSSNPQNLHLIPADMPEFIPAKKCLSLPAAKPFTDT
ncbi:hypothetical protein C1O63_0206 [Dehalococcoides mccartyi]|nr:hypothetical protein C1O63_0206 [Dehalococcoides mccartyi]